MALIRIVVHVWYVQYVNVSNMTIVAICNKVMFSKFWFTLFPYVDGDGGYDRYMTIMALV